MTVDDAPGSVHFGRVPARAGLPSWYPDLLQSVALRIGTGHRRAVRAANTELVQTYWLIGRDILDRQDAEGWGSKIIDRLSADLKQRFPEATGFSPRNLKYMRAFAEAWPDPAIVQARLAQLPWYHQIALLLQAGPDDQPTIGLLLCRSKNNVVAEYALRGYSTPIGVAEWSTAITTSIPDDIAAGLPTIAELETELAPHRDSGDLS